jgi:hypothetical protein
MRFLIMGHKNVLILLKILSFWCNPQKDIRNKESSATSMGLGCGNFLMNLKYYLVQIAPNIFFAIQLFKMCLWNASSY